MSDANEVQVIEIKLSRDDLIALHSVHLGILIEVKRVCDELGINFQLGGGTLLGAVRHGGFIPWDDDADIFMPRSDYDRFLSEAPGKLRAGFFLQTFKSDSGYDGLYAKLRRDGTEFREVANYQREQHHGVYVDVFPLDVVRPDCWWGLLHLRAVMLARSLHRITYTQRGKISTRHNFWKRCLASVLCSCVNLVPEPFVLCLADRLCGLLQSCKTGVIGILTCTQDLTRVQELLKPRSHMVNDTTLMFEGIPFPVPANYEAVLRQGYGDFMALPAEYLRKPKHSICELNIPRALLNGESC